MRRMIPSLLLTLLAALPAGCAQAPPADAGAAAETSPLLQKKVNYPSLAYSDAEVEALRTKLAAIPYPQPAGATLKALGLAGLSQSTTAITDYKPNAQFLAASLEKNYVLNARAQLRIVEHQYVEKNGNSRLEEHEASIRP